MKRTFSYPTSYEVEHALSQFCRKTFIDSFAQARGIFLVRPSKEDIAGELSKLHYDRQDLDKIKNAAFKNNINQTLSGFILETSSGLFDPVTEMQKIRATNGAENELTFSPIIVDTEDSTVFTGHVYYKSYKPGRLEFLQGEERVFDYTLQKIDSNLYQYFIEGSKSTDSKLLEDSLKKSIEKKGEIKTINYDKLITKQTIVFFDQLATVGLDNSWQFQQVSHIVIKKPKADDEGEEVKEEALTGINQAIIEGHDLRNISFVKKLEEEGYGFTAMTYQFSHKTSPHVLQIRAEFKSRPKVFEITIVGFKRREGIAQNLVEIPIDRKKEYLISTKFWNNAKSIYDKLTFGSRTIQEVAS